jgi:hypothetical protein
MATPSGSLPTRDAARQAIASFVKLARTAPSAKGSKEAELFGCSLPIALAKVGAATWAHASSSNAAVRSAVEDLSKEGFYSALAGVVDLLCAAPERRLVMPASTVLELPAPLNQDMAQMVEGYGRVPALPLWPLIIKECIGASCAWLPPVRSLATVHCGYHVLCLSACDMSGCIKL